MSDATAVDLALLLFRVGVGVVMLAHGINHVFGGGKIAGTGALVRVDGDAPTARTGLAGEPHRDRRRRAAGRWGC